MIEGIVRMMDSSDDITEPIKLGNYNEISIIRLAKK